MTKPKPVSPEMEAATDEAAGLKNISIRLPVSMIEDYQLLSKLNHRPYQVIMREALKRYADVAKTEMLRDAVQRREWGAQGGKPSHKKKENQNGP